MSKRVFFIFANLANNSYNIDCIRKPYIRTLGKQSTASLLLLEFKDIVGLLTNPKRSIQ